MSKENKTCTCHIALLDVRELNASIKWLKKSDARGKKVPSYLLALCQKEKKIFEENQVGNIKIPFLIYMIFVSCFHLNDGNEKFFTFDKLNFSFGSS